MRLDKLQTLQSVRSIAAIDSRSIRNSAKAIIIREGRLLLVRINTGAEDWYVLPGGGQRVGETLVETLHRECLEEIGVPVQVGPLRLVREYIGQRHDDPNHGHRVEFMFACQITDEAVPQCGPRPDSAQTGLLWAPLENLAAYELYPTGLANLLSNRATEPGCAYMGDTA